MLPLCRPVLLAVIAAGLVSTGASARGETASAPQRTPTAHCGDGTYYYGPRNRKLACAHHRGVAEWLAASNRSSSHHAASGTKRRSAGAPKGATARCRDGSYSFVRVRARACAGHRGVAKWLRAARAGQAH